MAKKRKTSTLSPDDVRHVADLAHLPLTEAELKKFQKQLSSILDYVNQLQEVDTSKVKETSQVTGLSNVFRSDEVGEGLTQSEALSNAKQTKDGYVQVKAVFNQE